MNLIVLYSIIRYSITESDRTVLNY